MHDFITGIQQIGIGVKDAQEAMQSYKKLLGMNILIFDDKAKAALMTKYTGKELYKRRAILTLNITGGGGLEIWQYLNRSPVAPHKSVKYGDLGIYAPKIKSLDIKTSYRMINDQNPQNTQFPLLKDIEGKHYFWMIDERGLPLQVVEALDYFNKNRNTLGGVSGAVVGVSNMESSVEFYGCLLGDFTIVYDKIIKYKSLTDDQNYNYHKVLLRKKTNPKGAFGKLLGGIDIELVQAMDRSPQTIYQDRYWGDLGYIHLCMDVINMEALKKHIEKQNYLFTIDSNDSFTMEAAAGRFCYVEDPDGALIELVETHKVPIMKKYGLFLNLKKRGLTKPLPRWMVKMMALSKVG